MSIATIEPQLKIQPVFDLALRLAKGKVALALIVYIYSIALAHNASNPIFSLTTVVFGIAAFWLESAGQDERPWALAGIYWLIALSFAERMLWPIYQTMGTHSLLARLIEGVRIEAMLPLSLFLFVEKFPGTIVLGPAKWVEAGKKAAALAAGVLFTCTLVSEISPRFSMKVLSSFSAPAMDHRPPDQTYYWIVILSLVIAAFGGGLFMMKSARENDRKRGRILLLCLTTGAAPLIIGILIRRILPGMQDVLARPPWLYIDAFVVYGGLFSVPLSTAHVILAQRILDVKVIVRRVLQYSLARYATLLVTFIPFGLLAFYIVRHSNESLIGLVGDGRGPLLVSIAALGVIGHKKRRIILNTVDRKFFRERYDSVNVIASLVDAARSVRTPVELNTLLHTEVDRALHLDAFSLLILDPHEDCLREPSGRFAPILNSSRLGQVLSSVRTPTKTDFENPISIFEALPETEKDWLLDASANLLVPIFANSKQLIGLMVLGEKRSGSSFSSEDMALLRTLSTAIGPVLERQLESAQGVLDSTQEPETAYTCSECRRANEVSGSCANCGADTAPALLPLLLFKKFRVEAEIGRGGMGVVYRATDLDLHRKVALKTLPRLSMDLAARLRREARAMAAVTHPNLASIYAFETWQGTPVLICEYLEKGTLADTLRAGKLSAHSALSLGVILAQGLHAVHRAGLLHRDIKPSNVGITADGTPKLLDFGLAQAIVSASRAKHGVTELAPGDSTVDAASVHGAIVGTPAYLAPEVWRGERYMVSVDLWALSVTLFESIAGVNPFRRDSYRPTIEAILGPTPNLRNFQPLVPPEVETLFKRLLAPNPYDRPTSALEFANALTSID